MAEAFPIVKISKPVSCQLCQHPIGKVFVDGRTKAGPWAYMCLPCFKVNGEGFGVGRGQEFTVEAKDPSIIRKTKG